MEKTFDVEIITPDRVFYKGTADLLEFNTESGEIGVYRDHIPLTTVLEPGLVTIHHGDEEQVAAGHAGFAEILGDKVTLLAELAEWPEEIDLERAEAARERAEERIHNRNDNLDLKRAEFALHKALIRILRRENSQLIKLHGKLVALHLVVGAVPLRRNLNVKLRQAHTHVNAAYCALRLWAQSRIVIHHILRRAVLAEYAEVSRSVVFLAHKLDAQHHNVVESVICAGNGVSALL
mgnify:CR=1 FL=1